MGREGEREIGENVSTLPEGSAGEGEEIRALLFKSVPVSAFFLPSQNKPVYGVILSHSCFSSFFVLLLTGILATIVLLISNEREEKT